MKRRSLVALAALCLSPALLATSEANLISGLAIVFADSEDTVVENGAAAHALDGDAATVWSTDASPDAAAPPHEIQIDLGALYELTRFRYVPRHESEDGRIDLYEFYTSRDGADWGAPVAAGFFENLPDAQEVTFQPVIGRFVRLRALREVRGGRRTAVAELAFFGTLFGGNAPPKGEIDSPAEHLDVVVGSGVQLSGSGSDPEDPPDALHV